VHGLLVEIRAALVLALFKPKPLVDLAADDTADLLDTRACHPSPRSRC
jgi:hypothetical protein